MEIKNRKRDALLPLVISLALVAGILIGVRFGSASPGNRGILSFPAIGKVSRALNMILNSYVDSVSANVLEEEAIIGMLNTLDPHSRYIPASNIIAENEPIEGNFSGIGVQFNMINDTVVIINTVAKGPSEKAGIMAGDRIVMVNDLPVAGVKMKSDEIIKMLKGKTGTTVEVSIRRNGSAEMLVFNLTRDKIPLVSVDVAYMPAPETGYIKVNKFSRTTLREFTEACSRLKELGMRKLILDLRDNGGGIIDAATGMAEMFLPGGSTVVYTEGNERPRNNYYARGENARCADTELALLINESSASAAEIMAGAIQDNDRGVIIGRRSFGKGLVQEQLTLPDGSALRLTVARYYTPTGRCIQKPYDRGDDEYFNELNTRYSNGEMLRIDSTLFNDSVRFVTPGGKTVYGGGGIMPDVFVAADTTYYSEYYARVMRQGLIYRFAFDYTDRHRKDLNEFADYRALEEHLRRCDLAKNFAVFAAKNGVKQDERGLRISGTAIENLITAYIVRNIFDDDGFYPVLNKHDETVLKAIELLTGNNDH